MLIGENMVKYTEKVDEKISIKKKTFFHENTRK
jgi:hypothetical protein